jgi:hypothetical protein
MATETIGDLGLEVPKPKRRITIELTPSKVAAIDETAKLLGKSRSEYLREIFERGLKDFGRDIRRERERRALIEEDDDGIGKFLGRRW